MSGTLDVHTGLFSVPEHDMTLNLGAGPNRRPPGRQRSKSDTYMASPISFNPDNMPFAMSSNFQGTLNPSVPNSAASIDPRALSGSSPMPTVGRGSLSPPLQAGQRADDNSALLIDNDNDNDNLGRYSEAGPALSARRRSAQSVAPYDIYGVSPLHHLHASGNNGFADPSPSQDFLLPPSPMRKTRFFSGGAGVGHRRGTVSEDWTSSFSPRTASFLQNQPSVNMGQTQNDPTLQSLPPMPNADSSSWDPSNSYNLPMMHSALPQPHQGNAGDDQQQYSRHQSPYSDYEAGTHEAPMPYMTMPGGISQAQVQAPGALPLPNYNLYGGMTLPQYTHLGNSPAGGGLMYSSPGGEDDLGHGGGAHQGQGHYNVYDHPTAVPTGQAATGGKGNGTLTANRARRRSSLHSEASGYGSSVSNANSEVTFESKTTEATKQAARRRRKDPNNARFICEYCGESFTRAYNLKGHIRSHEGSKPFGCSVCGKGGCEAYAAFLAEFSEEAAAACEAAC